MDDEHSLDEKQPSVMIHYVPSVSTNIYSKPMNTEPPSLLPEKSTHVQDSESEEGR